MMRLALPKGRNLIAARAAFRAAGYRTGAFTEVAWPLLQRGFGTFQNTAFKHTFGDPGANSAAPSSPMRRLAVTSSRWMALASCNRAWNGA